MTTIVIAEHVPDPLEVARDELVAAALRAASKTDAPVYLKDAAAAYRGQWLKVDGSSTALL